MVIKQLLKINREEFVRVSLLANMVGAPNSGQAFDDRARICAFLTNQVGNECCIATLVAAFPPLALLSVLVH